MTTRRDFLQLSAGGLTWALAGCGGGDGTPGTVVTTTSGTLSGQAQGNTAVFKGIPYAQSPVGALRLQSPKPYTPTTTGAAPALAFGAASLQTLPPYVTWIYPQPATQSEDCLTLNVWAPVGAVGAPVVVWLHGGAWRTGATSMPLMDGQKLAEQGLVVVTVNYRLGALATLAHPDFTDPDTGYAANWGLQDQAAALRWVRDNIAAFGGNAGNVCVVGQSAGATNAALLAQHPEWNRLLHKVVMLSAAGIAAPGAFSPGDAAAYTELLAKGLGTTPKGLLAIPAATLHAAELALNAQALPASFTTGLGVKASPVQDGKTVLSDWTSTAWPARVPVLMTNTLTEGTFFVDQYDPLTQAMLTAALPQTADALVAVVTPLAGSAARAATVISAYSQAASAEGRSTAPGDLYAEIYGDRSLRNFCVRYAGRLAAQGADVRYGTYMHSILPPGHGVPHCAEVPMLFSTYGLDYYRTKLGATVVEQTVSQHLVSAVASFAKGAAATFADGTPWPRYANDNKTSALIAAGTSSQIAFGAVPKQAQLAVWDGLLGY